MKAFQERVRNHLTLYELITGIILLSVIGEVFVLIFAKGERIPVTLSLFVGSLTGIWMAIHMNWSIETVLDFESGSATKMMQRYSIIRYAVAAFVLVLAGVSGYFHVVIVFAGMIFLKMAAYLQPFLHKPMVKIFGELPPGPSLPEDETSEEDEKDKDMETGGQEIIEENS